MFSKIMAFFGTKTFYIIMIIYCSYWVYYAINISYNIYTGIIQFICLILFIYFLIKRIQIEKKIKKRKEE